jgi:hypothetical protein
MSISEVILQLCAAGAPAPATVGQTPGPPAGPGFENAVARLCFCCLWKPCIHSCCSSFPGGFLRGNQLPIPSLGLIGWAQVTCKSCWEREFKAFFFLQDGKISRPMKDMLRSRFPWSHNLKYPYTSKDSLLRFGSMHPRAWPSVSFTFSSSPN